MSNNYYLVHGGPGSGRYPLGSGDRPYQKFEGKNGKRSGIAGYIQSRRAKKFEDQRLKQIKEQQRLKREQEENEKRLAADKERVLRSGSPEEVMRYKGQLSNKEWNEVAERLRLERQVSGYAEQDVKDALDKLKKVQAYTNVGSALAKDGIELWNSFAGIYNATPEGQKKPLTLINRGGGKKKEK